MKNLFQKDIRVPKKKHSLYYRWVALCAKCNITNENDKNYRTYAAKGIKVCDEWKTNYVKFLLWGTQHEYKKELVLCRKNKDADFCPENCFFGKHSHDTEPFNI
jgi:hypothetical protein